MHATALDAALRYLAVRPRSEAEVRMRLARTGFAEAAVAHAVAKLRERGLLDDAAFAQYWVDQRQTFRPRGARLLRAELRQHGVSSALAAETAAGADDSAEEDAYRAARKRALQLASADDNVFRARLTQLLARRGFDWETISTTVRRLQTELNRS